MSNLTYLDFELAVQKSLEIAENTKLKEIINLEDAIGRVLGENILCVKNLPSFNNSAMDGFAIKASDAGKILKVKKVVFAGERVNACLGENECYKIMTGAKVPNDVDTIIPIEDVLFYENEEVSIKENIKKGACLRVKGEEQKEGNVLFENGTVLNSSHIAVLASQGLTMLNVYKKISIAVVSTGNELREPWEKANEDEIYNCNSYALIALLKEKGFNATYTGVVPDSLDKSVEFIKNLKNYNVVITTGGISMGDADFVAEAFNQNGLITAFHGVNIKPGRPIMMGKMDKTFVMCLPGNPLTAMVNMHLFAIPVLNKIQGASSFYHDFKYAKNAHNFKVKSGRVNVVLGNLKEGKFEVTRENKYGSGMLSPLVESNCIVVTNEGRAGIEVSESVKVILFNSLMLENQTNIFN